RAPLVEEQHAVVLDGALDPELLPVRPGCAHAGPALEEEEKRESVPLVRVGGDLAGEDRDLLALRTVVFERQLEAMFLEHVAGEAVRGEQHAAQAKPRDAASARLPAEREGQLAVAARRGLRSVDAELELRPELLEQIALLAAVHLDAHSAAAGRAAVADCGG